MFRLALRNLFRRPWSSGVAAAGLAAAVALFLALTAMADFYRKNLASEIQQMGIHLMLVPLGCPYEAAAQALKGVPLEKLLPESALTAARADPSVAVAAPLLLVTSARPAEKRVEVWVGLDRDALALKPWWRVQSGQDWFPHERSVILGAEAALAEMRVPGDKLAHPSGMVLEVAGVLQRSGTSDDSLLFVPWRTAQSLAGTTNQLSAILIRLHDPATLREASARLQAIPGAQVVTMTELMGTFLNLLGSIRTVLLSVTILALAIGTLTVFNTLLTSVWSRTGELGLFRAMGASRAQIFSLVTAESILLSMGATAVGLLLAPLAVEAVGRGLQLWLSFNIDVDGAHSPQRWVQAFFVGLGAGVLAGIYPAWRASRCAPALAVKSLL